MRAAYAERQDALLRGVRRELDGLVEASPTETGMHLVAWLTRGSSDDTRASRRAWESGVEASALSTYVAEAAVRPGLLLGFAPVRPSDVGAGLRILRQAIR
jgi:GntR family transcriptional regulator/MocR family aminotransferase